MKIPKIKMNALGLLPGILLFSTALSAELLAPGSHCVGFQTTKGMFFVANSVVTGKNCKVEAQITNSPQGLRFSLKAPLAGFDSGNPKRDVRIPELLGAPESGWLHFRSNSYPPATIRNAFRNGEMKIKGRLSFSGASHLRAPFIPSAADRD